MATELQTLANGKINLCLALGQLRSDGYHDLVSVMLPVDLADEVRIGPAAGEADEVDCAGVDGDNLALAAVVAWRARTGWQGDPVRITITKRIPVAAGMGGGSADAAAALRLIAEFAGSSDAQVLNEIAPTLGADVPPLLAGGPTLVEGTGTAVTRLPTLNVPGLLVLPSTVGLSTPDVFRRAGELGLRRPSSEIGSIAGAFRAAATGDGWQLPPDLLGVNDLGPAAADLEPSVAQALADARSAGAEQAFVTGSGPTVVGLFHGAEGEDRARAAADQLADRAGGSIWCSASAGSATIEAVR